MTLEVIWRSRSAAFDRLTPRQSSINPILLTDPLQASLYNLKPEDIVLCHDLGPVTHPHFYAAGVKTLYDKAYQEICRVRPHLVFVSHASRREFDRLYGPAYRSCRIIPCSIRQDAFEGDAVPVNGVKRPFLLTVGAVGDRKNQADVVRAFDRSRLARGGVQFVIAGGPEPGYDRVVQAAAIAEGVRLLGYVSEEQLRWLYRNCVGFVLASRLEGFGMPAAEALLQGAVPLVSADSALSEVAGAAAIVVDPTDEQSICDGLLKLCALDPEERRRRLSGAADHLADFSEAATRALWKDAFEVALAG